MSAATLPPLILAIDTSCDETSIAVTRGVEVWSNVVASQAQLHRPYGGVFPTVAKQAHREHLPAAVSKALKQAGVSWSDIGAIAVTIGPGLAPALETGIVYAQTLAAEHHLPVIPVNHIEAHALSVLARGKSKKTSATHDFIPTLKFPILSLIISGGHTLLVAIDDWGSYRILGTTIDDAAGEVLDKVGRMLDLGYPAGPVMETLAKVGNDKSLTFPLPMTTSRNYNLSFSGMKTFARNKIEALSGNHQLTAAEVADFCASFQKAIFRAICYKLNKLLQKEQFSEVWLGGGVAANLTLRAQLRATIRPYGLTLRTPYTKRLCGDNAAMIGLVAGMPKHLGLAALSLDRRPKWPLAQSPTLQP